jgi:hypothetical protein
MAHCLASPPVAGVPPGAHGRLWQTPQTCHASEDPGPYGTRQKPLLPANQDGRCYQTVQKFVFFKPKLCLKWGLQSLPC